MNQTLGADRFYRTASANRDLQGISLVSLFAYFLTIELGRDGATATAIDACFSECDLNPPSNTAVQLTRGVKAEQFVKSKVGYKLHRDYRDEIGRALGSKDLAVTQSSAELRKLEGKLADGSKKEFFRETLNCFEAGANRATIIMCWILALDHLYDHVWSHHLSAFNMALRVNTDKRVKIESINIRDDFTEIPEGKFIEFLRSARIISNDVRKILDTKLGIRNSSAHPSSVAIKPSKVVEFVDDLVENIILKYPT